MGSEDNIRSLLVTRNPARAPTDSKRLLGDESVFRSWYGAWANRLGLDPDPDHPEHRYDWRAAYRSGAMPDADMHWPSEFKHDDHPNRFIDGVDTKARR